MFLHHPDQAFVSPSQHEELSWADGERERERERGKEEEREDENKRENENDFNQLLQRQIFSRAIIAPLLSVSKLHFIFYKCNFIKLDEI